MSNKVLMPDASADVETFPVVICIARDYGTEAHEIGLLLSKELGIPLYDNELLVRSSERAGVTTNEAASYDEVIAAELAAFLPDRFDARSRADKLFKQMEQVILDLGSSESCIIEGRLADYILRDNPNLISVFLTAPFDARVEIVRRKRDCSVKKAEKLVKTMQKARELYYKRYSAGKWHLGKNNDLVVNRAIFGRQGCTDIIAAAYRTKQAAVERVAKAAQAAAEQTSTDAKDSD